MASYSIPNQKELFKPAYSKAKNLGTALTAKRPWNKRKYKETQATRSRKKHQFSLSDAAKRKLAAMAKRTSGVT